MVKDNYEIGCHGYDNSGQFQFDNKNKFDYKTKKIMEFKNEFEIKKYRSPAYVHSEKSLEFVMENFEEDWSFRDLYFDNGLKGLFYSDEFNYKNIKFKVSNIFEDALLLNAKLKEKQIIEIIKKKVFYLQEYGIQPVLSIHPEPHFLGGHLSLLKNIIDALD